MRNGWQLKKLGDFISEYSVKNRCNETIPVYSVTNSQGFCKDYFSKEVASLDKSTYKIVPYGCFAYNPSRINVGSVDWQNKEERVIVSPLYNVFSVSENLNQDFLLYFIKSNGTMGIINTLATGTVRLNLKLSMLKEFPITVPPLSDQQSIVEELNTINELIRLKKEQLDDYDKLSQSIFSEMFGDPIENEKGWEVKKFSEVASFKNGLNFGKNENGYSYKILGVGDFKNNYVVNSSLLEYINLNDELSSDYFLKPEDIVFVRSNGSKELVGRCVSVDCTEPTTYSGFCIRCRLDENSGVLPMYLLYVCKNKGIREYLTQSGRGCNISNVNQKILNSTDIIIPPLSLQQLFAQRIELIEQQKDEIKSTIADLETLLASRMQYWFD